MNEATTSVTETMAQALAGVDVEAVRRRYWEQNEFIHLDRWLPRPLVERLVAEVDRVRPAINRNYIPRHKKGGSVSFYTLQEQAPTIVALYRSPAFLDFLAGLTGRRLQPCPPSDPHSCALYFYTEPGDHIGFHFDTSYYRGARYTVLLGLIERSSSRLVCQLYKNDPQRAPVELQLATDPGTLDPLQRRQAVARGDAAGGGGGAGEPHAGVRHRPLDAPGEAALLEPEGRLRLLRVQGRVPPARPRLTDSTSRASQ